MKNVKYWVQYELTQYDSQNEPHLVDRYSEYEHKAALEAFAEAPEGFDYKPATRNSHFTALNCLPVVVGTRWAISEEVRWEFLEMLPPIDRPAGGFYISEADCVGPNGGNIRSAYYKDSTGQYWHEYEETTF